MLCGGMVAVVQANTDDVAGIGNGGLKCTLLKFVHCCSRCSPMYIVSKRMGTFASREKIEHASWQARLGTVQINDHFVPIPHQQRTETNFPMLTKGDPRHGNISFRFTQSCWTPRQGCYIQPILSSP